MANLDDAVDVEDNLVYVALRGPSAAALLHINQHSGRLVLDVNGGRGLCRWSQPEVHPDSALRRIVVIRHLSSKFTFSKLPSFLIQSQ